MYLLYETSVFSQQYRQILPVVSGCMLCVSFGLMFGWASPMFPILLEVNSPVQITLGQSSFIAGFLMWGNLAGTPISSVQWVGSKNGMLIGLAFMVCGWIAMYNVGDFFGLCGSRWLVGFGHGFGNGQLKHYIQEVCEPELSRVFQKYLVLFVNCGVILAFVIGPFVEFRTLAIVGISLTSIFLFILCFVPKSPGDYLLKGNYDEARRLYKWFRPNNCSLDEIKKYEKEVIANKTCEHMSFFELLRNRETRNSFLILMFLVFVQQYSGGPAAIVYSQIIFQESGTSYPQYNAILYGVEFLITTALGIRFSSKFNMKYLVVSACLGVALTLTLQISAIYFHLNRLQWSYFTVLVMMFYNVIHTMGVASVPIIFIQDCFPKPAKRVVTHFFIMYFSVLALTSTKLFQMAFERWGMHLGFCLFLGVSLSGAVGFMIIKIPTIYVEQKPEKSSKKSEITRF